MFEDLDALLTPTEGNAAPSATATVVPPCDSWRGRPGEFAWIPRTGAALGSLEGGDDEDDRNACCFEFPGWREVGHGSEYVAFAMPHPRDAIGVDRADALKGVTYLGGERGAAIIPTVCVARVPWLLTTHGVELMLRGARKLTTVHDSQKQEVQDLTQLDLRNVILREAVRMQREVGFAEALRERIPDRIALRRLALPVATVTSSFELLGIAFSSVLCCTLHERALCHVGVLCERGVFALAPDAIRAVALDVCAALSAMHEIGAVHGDVAVRNCLAFGAPEVGEDLQRWLASPVDGRPERTPAWNSRLFSRCALGDFSASFFVAGSIGRADTLRLHRGAAQGISPELRADVAAPATAASDVWAFGVLLLELMDAMWFDPTRNPMFTLRSDIMTAFVHSIVSPSSLPPGRADVMLRERVLPEASRLVEMHFGATGNSAEIAKALLSVAFACLRERPQERPTMQSVSDMLRSANGRLQGTDEGPVSSNPPVQ